MAAVRSWLQEAPRISSRKLDKQNLMARDGIEPPTPAFSGPRSTTELSGLGFCFHLRASPRADVEQTRATEVWMTLVTCQPVSTRNARERNGSGERKPSIAMSSLIANRGCLVAVSALFVLRCKLPSAALLTVFSGKQPREGRLLCSLKTRASSRCLLSLSAGQAACQRPSHSRVPM